jgi:hypothetical protein
MLALELPNKTDLSSPCSARASSLPSGQRLPSRSFCAHAALRKLLALGFYDFALKALVVTSVFAVTSGYCRRGIAICTAILTTMWLFGLSGSGSTIIPVSLLNLIASALVLPVFDRRLSAKRMLVAGGCRRHGDFVSL